jgi:SOS-response transcriptional repressor LexA
MSDLKEKIGERIREFAELKFKTLKNLADALGMVPQTLQQYISGKTMPGGEIIKKLADLGADIHYLLTGEKLKEKIAEDAIKESTSKISGYDFPLVSMLSAGSMIEFFTDEHLEKVAFTYYKKLGCSALKVKGDSMSPTIENGDIVLVDSDARLIDGCIVAARLKSGEQVIKRFRVLPHDLIQLDSDNFLYDPITVSREEVELIMPVVKVQREIYKS